MKTITLGFKQQTFHSFFSNKLAVIFAVMLTFAGTLVPLNTANAFSNTSVINGNLESSTVNFSDAETLKMNFTLGYRANVWVYVVDSSKRVVKKIYRSSGLLPAGTYTSSDIKSLTWDGLNDTGQKVTAGSYAVYFEANRWDRWLIRDKEFFTVEAKEQIQTSPTLATDDLTTYDQQQKPEPNNSNAMVYGTGLASNSLANLQIGRNQGAQISYRFKAVKTEPVSSVLIFVKNNMGGCSDADYNALKCYYHGDGGQIKLQLKTDDGSANHFPSSTILATSLVTDPMKTYWRTFTFDKQATLTEGKIYHMVFTNPAPDPINNFVSINDLRTLEGTPMQPGYNDSDLAVVWKYSGSSAWTVNKKHTPIFSLNYTDGTRQGIGYIDVPSSSRITVSSSSKGRENFTVSGADRTVNQLAVKTNGSGTMNLRLEKSDGTLIEEGQVSGSGWLVYNFKTPVILKSGSSYNTVFSAVSGSFTLPTLQEGKIYGFSPYTFFSDGIAQKTSNTSWTSLPNHDIQFYLK